VLQDGKEKYQKRKEKRLTRKGKSELCALCVCVRTIPGVACLVVERQSSAPLCTHPWAFWGELDGKAINQNTLSYFSCYFSVSFSHEKAASFYIEPNLWLPLFLISPFITAGSPLDILGSENWQVTKSWVIIARECSSLIHNCSNPKYQYPTREELGFCLLWQR
jgi:hypothetical protein